MNFTEELGCDQMLCLERTVFRPPQPPSVPSGLSLAQRMVLLGDLQSTHSPEIVCLRYHIMFTLDSTFHYQLRMHW